MIKASFVSLVAVSILSVVAYADVSRSNSGGQTSQLVATMPDYTKWQKVGARKLNATLSGQSVVLEAEFYRDTSTYLSPDSSGQWEVDRGVVVIKNDRNESWIGMYSESCTLKASIPTTPLESYYLYESVNGKWDFVKDFSYVSAFGKTDQERLQNDTDDLLKEKYDLVIK